MPATTLTERALNRATLARQMLLARERITPLRAIERLVGLQAQLARPPFIGLWSRVADFRRQDLTRLIESHTVVRATTMRGTLHLMSAKDYLALRPALQPALTQAAQRAKGIEVDRVIAMGREYFAQEPRAFEEFRHFLSKRQPKGDIRAMAYLVRMHLPLVQVPAQAPWGYPGTSDFALAETWIGEPVEDGDAHPGPLVLRYLAAFGPANVNDMQTWSGLPSPLLRDAFAALRPKLRLLRDGRGKELFDLPNAPRPPEDAEAPVRFLPEYDNLILSHADRRRFIADEHRRSVFLAALRVAPTFLLDGFVAGTWKVERKKTSAALAIDPFAALSKKAREELAAEGDRLVRFLEYDAGAFEVRFAGARPPARDGTRRTKSPALMARGRGASG